MIEKRVKKFWKYLFKYFQQVFKTEKKNLLKKRIRLTEHLVFGDVNVD
jgi:hypothetical protein